METLQTAIEFVSKESVHPDVAPSATTGDPLFLIFLACFIVISFIALLRKKKFIGGIFAILSVIVLFTNISIASPDQAGISVPEKVQAIVDIENKTVNIEDGFINNMSDNKCELKNIELEKVADKGNDKWNINDWYNDYAGKKVDVDIPFEKGEKCNVKFSTDASFDTCKELIGQTAVIVKFNFQKYTDVSGVCTDKDGKALKGVQLTLNELSNKMTISDDNGFYKFEQLPAGKKATLKVKYENKPVQTLEFEIGFNNFNFDVLVKDKAIDATTKPDPTYNKEEQVGVEGNPTIELRSYSAKNAGDYVAIATPAWGYIWEDGQETHTYQWKINKADAQITSVPTFNVCANGVTALKTTQYEGEQDDMSKVHVTFDKTCITVNEVKGTPQNYQFSIKCNANPVATQGTIKFDACKNYNEVSSNFNINIVPGVTLSGNVSSQQTEVGHSPYNASKAVKFTYADSEGDKITLSTSTDANDHFVFSGIPDNVDGTLSCNDFGYFSKSDVHISGDTTQDLTITGPSFDNYSVEELRIVSDKIGAGDTTLQTEFEGYRDSNTIWFSQSNSLQQTSDIEDVDPSLCNQDYKCNFEINNTKILPEDYDLCKFMFLRVVGINQGMYANEDGTSIGKKIGLTFQTVRSLPQQYALQDNEHKNVSWWGDKNNALRTSLNKGDIFQSLAKPFQENLICTQKKSQVTPIDSLNTKLTGDKMFPLSHSEMCATNEPQFNFAYLKTNGEGEQYQWYAKHNIQAKADNPDLAELGLSNSGEPMGILMPIATGRSVYPYSVSKQQFLTINGDGKIYSFNKSFNEKNGIAPAFSLGSMEGLKHITLQGENVTFTDVDGNEMSNSRYTSESSIKFKVVPKTGVNIVSVKVNDQVIQPSSGIYTANITTAETLIKVSTEGESQDAPYITGTANVVKHVGDTVQKIPYTDEIVSFYLDGQSEPIATTQVEENGNYQLDLLDKGLVGKSGTIKISSKPGANAYSKKITLKLDKNTNDIVINGFDYYTFEELSKVGDWLNAHENDSNLKNTDLYKEFDSYINENCIWYSNSNGTQPLNVAYNNPNAAIAARCNQDYKCSFDGGRDKNQFLFLRVIDILHDPLSSGKGHAGLTFQTIHSIPVKTVFGGKWWGESSLRTSLQSTGDVFKKFSACNMTDYIVTVDKYSQADRGEAPNIKVTKDKFFTLSYSEIWAVNGVMTNNRSWYGNSGNNTEGYTYKWFKVHNIDGSQTSEAIKFMHWDNNGVDVGEKSCTWERSVYFDNEAYSMLVRVGAPNSYNYDTSGEGIAPAFCLGGK